MILASLPKENLSILFMHGIVQRLGLQLLLLVRQPWQPSLVCPELSTGNGYWDNLVSSVLQFQMLDPARMVGSTHQYYQVLPLTQDNISAQVSTLQEWRTAQ